MKRRDFLVTSLGLMLVACGRRPQAAAGLHYQVQEGDTLSSIARRAKLPIGAIVSANGLSSRELRPGQSLVLPGVRELDVDPLAASRADRRRSTIGPVDGAAYRIVPRSAWGAASPGSDTEAMNGVNRITLHHTAHIHGMDSMAEPEVMRAICAMHRKRGFADIGYHFVVGRDGRVYEGRASYLQGAHASGENNRNNLGICLIGDCSHRLPPTRQLATFELLLRDQLARYKLAGSRVYGHRDLRNTLCPGEAMYRWLNEWKRRA